MAISLWSVSTMVAPTIGPTVGGLLTYYFGWKLLFFSMVPIGALAAVSAFLFIPEQNEKKSVSLDKFGLATVVIGNVSFLLYFNQGAEIGWLSNPALALLLAGVMGMAAFIWRELTAKEPLLNIKVFQYSKYAWGTLLNCLITAGLYSSMYLIPLFMESAQGVSPLTVGLVMLPGALIMIVITMITGRLQDKLDPVWLILSGTVLFSIATWEFSQLNIDSSFEYIIFWMIIRFIGVGLSFSSVTSISMSVIPTEIAGHASSITNWLRQAFTALSVAIFTSILALRTEAHLSELGEVMTGKSLQRFAFLYATNDTFLVSTSVLLITIPLSLALKNRKPKKNVVGVIDQQANIK